VVTPQPPAGPRPTPTVAPERRRTPAGARGPYFAAVRRAWRAACEAGDPDRPELALALATFGCDGRARGVPVETLLRALDTIVHEADAERLELSAAGTRASAREWAGERVIRAYCAAD
jgi:hypothetical protein